MTKIPLKLRKDMASDPFYRQCARKGIDGHECAGRVTWEHAIIYAGRQVQAKWAIIPLCAKAHSVDGWQDRGCLDKQINEWIALNRATMDELRSISKSRDYVHYRAFLNDKYGPYTVEKPVDDLLVMRGQTVEINYGFLGI